VSGARLEELVVGEHKIRLWLIVAITMTLAPSLCTGQVISTVAGSATCCNSSDGGAATSTWLPAVGGLTLDSAGNLYIWDTASSTIRKVNTVGIISTVAGNGTAGGTGDGGPATSAQLFASGSISGLAMDSAGNLYIGDGNNHRVRKVNTAGIISTVAGTGAPGFSGDGGPATSATLFYPAGIAVDNAGNLYIADSSNNRVRKVNAAGIISTVAGNGNVSYSGDGVMATTTAVDRPEGVTVDSAGNLYISETSQSRVRKVNASGIISTVAGLTTKTNGFSGDGGPATSAKLAGPIGMAVDSAGNLYIADNSNGRIRKVDAAGIITTFAGNGAAAASNPLGDGGPATSATLGVPKDVAISASGNVYIGGSGGGVARVRKVSAAATPISTAPASLSFSYTIGAAIPDAQTVSVSSPGAALTFTATASTSSGGNWLTVSPGSNTTPATLNVSITPTGLPGGIYQGAITLTPGGAGPQSFAVTLTVNGAGAPAFNSTSIVNALGYQSKLAPDTVFVIFGSGLGPASLAAGAGPDYPTSVGGTSITFTPAAGGPAINAKMVYSVGGQVAGLLPSSITPGTYAVRVTYNTLTSAPQNVTVVARSFGIATANSAGTGTAQATIGNVNGGVSLVRFTRGSVAFNGLNWALSPAHPGDTLVLWGTGGGADPANDTGGTSGDQTQAGNFTVNVGGHQITPLYAGASSGYPGLWQINFTLPADMAPDCFATAQVSAGGELSNTVSIPIAAADQNTCSDPQLSGNALASLDAGGTIVGGGFGISKIASTFSSIATPGAATTTITTNQEAVGGGIARYTAAEYAAIYAGLKFGACTVSDRTAPSTAKPPASPEGYLDAGRTIPVSGPSLAAGAALAVASANPGPIYSLSLANGTVVGGGKYTLTGTGGSGMGAFTASVNFPSSFTVTNWDSLSTIDRTAPLTLNWTGGSDQVYIIASTSMVLGKDASNTNILHTVILNCQVPASPGTFSVPAAALAYLLPAGIEAARLATGSAVLAVETVSTQAFTAPLVGGGQTDFTGFSSTLGVSKNLAVR
jgi:uncharacterized protein (TIGR03437 family)